MRIRRIEFERDDAESSAVDSLRRCRYASEPAIATLSSARPMQHAVVLISHRRPSSNREPDESCVPPSSAPAKRSVDARRCVQITCPDPMLNRSRRKTTTGSRAVINSRQQAHTEAIECHEASRRCVSRDADHLPRGRRVRVRLMRRAGGVPSSPSPFESAVRFG